MSNGAQSHPDGSEQNGQLCGLAVVGVGPCVGLMRHEPLGSRLRREACRGIGLRTRWALAASKERGFALGTPASLTLQAQAQGLATR